MRRMRKLGIIRTQAEGLHSPLFGQGLIEYGLILALIAIVVIVAISAFATQTNALIGRSASSLS